MKTYTAFNMNTMNMICKAIDSLPADYALRGEAVRSITMNEDNTLVCVQFAAMHMTRVEIPELSLSGWRIEGSDQIWIER